MSMQSARHSPSDRPSAAPPPARHTLVAVVQDRPGAIDRILGLVRRRGFASHGFAVGPSETAGLSRVTLVVSHADVPQALAQLRRIVEVLDVRDVTPHGPVERETALVKLATDGADAGAVVEAAGSFRARVAEIGAGIVLVEVSDAPERVDALVERLRPFGILEIARTGRVALALRGDEPTYRWQADGFADPSAA